VGVSPLRPVGFVSFPGSSLGTHFLEAPASRVRESPPWNEIAPANFSAARFFPAPLRAKLRRNSQPANSFRRAALSALNSPTLETLAPARPRSVKTTNLRKIKQCAAANPCRRAPNCIPSFSNSSLRSKTIPRIFTSRANLQPVRSPQPKAAQSLPPAPRAATFFARPKQKGHGWSKVPPFRLTILQAGPEGVDSPCRQRR